MTMKLPSTKTIEQRVEAALNIFLCNDMELLDFDANERAIAHKFAEYLQVVFKHWHVDCEYNRDGHEHDPKRLPLPSNRNIEQVRDTTVYPDIIVHRRGQAVNLLVIEVKKSSNKDSVAVQFDETKLRSYIDHLGYRLGLLITFRTDASLSQPYTLQWKHQRTSLDNANEVHTP